MKFKYIVVYENKRDKFNIRHCRTKVKVTARLKIFCPFVQLLQYKISGAITQLWYKLGSWYLGCTFMGVHTRQICSSRSHKHNL